MAGEWRLEPGSVTINDLYLDYYISGAVQLCHSGQWHYIIYSDIWMTGDAARDICMALNCTTGIAKQIFNKLYNTTVFYVYRFIS